jgi:hypothetical protein
MTLKLLTDTQSAIPVGDPVKYESYSRSDYYVRRKAIRMAEEHAKQFSDTNAFSMSMDSRYYGTHRYTTLTVQLYRE